MNILIVEDDRYLSQKIYEIFSSKSTINRVKTLHSYSEFLHESKFTAYDVIVLDIMLGEGDQKGGFQILKHIRKKDHQIPVIIMSSISEYSFLEEAFSLGAHDYVIKPFRVRELQIRVQRWFNSYIFCECYNYQKVLMYHGLMYYPESNEFYLGKKHISLCKSNKYLLSLLLVNKEKLLSQLFLSEKLWGDSASLDDKNLRIKIFRLKQELKKFKLDSWIHTIRGEGYVLKK